MDYTEEDLINCRLEGKTFDEILPDIQRMIYYYTRIYYEKWKTIMKNNLYELDDVAQDMFVSICNKKDKKGLSNIQKKFIQASKEDLGMKYISNLIGKTVSLNVTCIARGFNKKPKPVSFLEIVAKTNDPDSDKKVDYLDLLEDKRQDMDLKSSYDLFISSLPYRAYNDYFVESKSGKLVTLDIYNIIDMVRNKLTITEMTKLVTTKKGINISYKRMNEIVKEIRSIAKKSYDEGNCVIDI